jgi:1,4-alpha-glucan branching enzyme
VRNGHGPGEHMLVACNFTPVPRYGYRMGVPQGGQWIECLNTDSAYYAGSGKGNLGAVRAEPTPLHGMPMSVSLTLPPLSVLWFEPEPA